MAAYNDRIDVTCCGNWTLTDCLTVVLQGAAIKTPHYAKCIRPIVARRWIPRPAMARTTCEICLNPRTFFVVRRGVGVSDNAVQNVYTAVRRTFVTFRTVQRNA